MKKYFLLFFFLIAQQTYLFAQTPLWQSKGRIVVSADGNEHDHDDWAATPLSLAIIAAKGLQHRVPLYVYSDHIWGSNHEHPGIDDKSPYEQMKESTIKAGKMFGFNETTFICAVDNPEIAYEALKMEINKSSVSDPLFIIVGGPLQVIGEAIARADSSKRKFVTVISTKDSWNDDHSDKPYLNWENHSGWTMKEIKQLFLKADSNAIHIIAIQNQNPFLKKNWKEYEWLKTAPERNNPYYRKGSWLWLFKRLCTSLKPDTEGAYYCYAIDPSDAGKVIFLLTGIEKTSPQLCYEVMRTPPASKKQKNKIDN